MIERTQAGLRAAREQGRVGGRQRIMTDSKIRSARKLLSEGTPPKEVAKNLGVSVLPSTAVSGNEDRQGFNSAAAVGARDF